MRLRFFCFFVVIGCTNQLNSVLDFFDEITSTMALANVIGLYLLVSAIRKELVAH